MYSCRLQYLIILTIINKYPALHSKDFLVACFPGCLIMDSKLDDRLVQRFNLLFFLELNCRSIDTAVST